jgi:uncharacterized protein (DUF1778 family)
MPLGVAARSTPAADHRSALRLEGCIVWLIVRDQPDVQRVYSGRMARSADNPSKADAKRATTRSKKTAAKASGKTSKRAAKAATAAAAKSSVKGRHAAPGSKAKARTARATPRAETSVPKSRGVKGRRLSLRVEDQDHALFDRAADSNRETLTQFLVAGGRERAERLLADRTRFVLAPEAWDELVTVMDREAEPNPRLARLFSRRHPD